MTSGEQLQRYADAHATAERGDFLGVFDPATLRAYRAPTGSNIQTLIMNCSGPPGSHWVAARLNRGGGSAEFFSSMGMRPDGADAYTGVTTHFGEWIAANAGLADQDQIKVSHYKLQGFGPPPVCGQYAALFVRDGMPSAAVPSWARILAAPTAGGRDALVAEIVSIL